VDELPGKDALFNVVRVRRDFGGNSVAGVTATDVESPDETIDFNRVVAGDVRVVFGKLYYLEGQLGRSWTRVLFDGNPIATLESPIWKAELDRTGRAWGFNYQLNGLGKTFATYAGFVPRTNVTSFHAFNRFTRYGARGALLENLTSYFGPTRLWDYADFGHRGAIEGREEITAIATLRGGWIVTATAVRSFFELDHAIYSVYRVDRGGGVTEPYVVPDQLSGLLQGALELTTPTFQTANATFRLTRAEVPIFAEGAGATSGARRAP
jgi:hypothetical protein